MIQDGAEPFDAHVREVSGEERTLWWDRGRGLPRLRRVPAGDDRVIPVFVATRR